MIINPNILNEGNQMEVLDATIYKKTHDELDLIVRCNNCGQPTRYGETRMINGFVGCDNKIMIDGKEVECYFDDLMPRIIKSKEKYYEENMKDKNNLYHTGKVYRWRDKADGGIKIEKSNN